MFDRQAKMSENVKVVVRCRPMNRKENESRCEDSESSDISKETYNVNILQNYFRSSRQKNKDYEPSTHRTKKFYGEKDVLSTKINIPMATQLKKLVHPIKSITDPDHFKMENLLGQEELLTPTANKNSKPDLILLDEEISG
ncbi:uncharacterized protein LOC117902960 isoform X7 [Drosophila subobscura]|uniref:uncharacterized protein LOC117902960 isoform X7 n=1 Tax=Drosophila subobscura TaxID=7241 RepID=UPI00155A8DB0|nr:uncharacterized protein LOC117902960 isoform X7 [Drosophila subobscura]